MCGGAADRGGGRPRIPREPRPSTRCGVDGGASASGAAFREGGNAADHLVHAHEHLVHAREHVIHAHEHLGSDDEHLGNDDEHLGSDDEHLGIDDEHLGIDDEHLGSDDEHFGNDAEHLVHAHEHLAGTGAPNLPRCWRSRSSGWRSRSSDGAAGDPRPERVANLASVVVPLGVPRGEPAPEVVNTTGGTSGPIPGATGTTTTAGGSGSRSSLYWEASPSPLSQDLSSRSAADGRAARARAAGRRKLEA